LNRLTHFYWRVTRAGSQKTWSHFIVRSHAWTRIPTPQITSIKKNASLNECIFAKYVYFYIQSEQTAGYLALPSNWATKICRRTRSPPESTRTSIFIVKKAKLTPSRRAQSSAHRVGYVREWPKSWQDRDHNDRWDALLA